MPLTWTAVYVVTLGSIAIICIGRLYLQKSRNRSHPLPPGPPGLPWIGNVIGINANAPWVTYREWAKIYGDLLYSRLLGKDVIIINSENVAKELLEIRSRNYSDRPFLVTNELCGTEFNSGLLSYGDNWRLHRRFFHRTFRNDAVARFRPLQHRKSCQLLRQLLSTPNQFSQHVFDYTASLILNSVYDYDPTSRKDELAEVISKVLEILLAAVRPETALIVGAFPILLRLPAWLPGMSFKKRMGIAKEFTKQYVERPFEYSMQKLLSGCSAPSMVYDSLQTVGFGDVATDHAWVKELKGAAASAFLGGAETSNSVLMTFILMMVLNPEFQEKAQTQIDLVIGRDRLPTIGDRPSLPYVDAILREVYRYNPTVPLALPHAVVDDDIYSGYHIPKGAVVLLNMWSMSRNEYKYPNPHKFDPERFLNKDGSLLPNDTDQFTFGFGRRICPGRHFADVSIWIAIAQVLAVFYISKAKDADGMEIPVEPKFSSGLSSHPLPFACNIMPRTPGLGAEQLEQLIGAFIA